LVVSYDNGDVDFYVMESEVGLEKEIGLGLGLEEGILPLIFLLTSFISSFE
jgi:hypothetical protein